MIDTTYLNNTQTLGRLYNVVFVLLKKISSCSSSGALNYSIYSNYYSNNDYFSE